MPAGQHIAHFYICTRSARSSFSPPLPPALPRLGLRDKLLKLILGGGLPAQACAGQTHKHTTQTRDKTRTHTCTGDSPLWRTPAGSPGPHTALMTSCLNSILKCPSFSCLYLAGEGRVSGHCVTVSACVHHLTGCLETPRASVWPALDCTAHRTRARPGHRATAGWSPAHLSLTARPETGTGGPSPARCLTHRTLHITLCH